MFSSEVTVCCVPPQTPQLPLLFQDLRYQTTLPQCHLWWSGDPRASTLSLTTPDTSVQPLAAPGPSLLSHLQHQQVQHTMSYQHPRLGLQQSAASSPRSPGCSSNPVESIPVSGSLSPALLSVGDNHRAEYAEDESVVTNMTIINESGRASPQYVGWWTSFITRFGNSDEKEKDLLQVVQHYRRENPDLLKASLAKKWYVFLWSNYPYILTEANYIF